MRRRQQRFILGGVCTPGVVSEPRRVPQLEVNQNECDLVEARRFISRVGWRVFGGGESIQRTSDNFLMDDDFLRIILKANVKKCLKEPFEKSACYVFVFLPNDFLRRLGHGVTVWKTVRLWCLFPSEGVRRRSG